MPPVGIVTTDLPIATPTYNYKTTLTASGGVQPLVWSLASGSLPAGLILNSAGEIYGIPTNGGATSAFTLKVTDSSGGVGGATSAQQSYSITVAGILSVPTITLPDGTVGRAYSTTLPYSGGTLPLTWSIYSGSIPTGTVLNQTTGVISGTPTQQGTYTFQMYLTDSSPTQQNYTSSAFTITVNPSGPLAIRTTALMDGTVGTAYAAQLVATGGTTPYGWSVTSGTLPAGLNLGTTTGAISGIPTAAAGTYAFTVGITDSSSTTETASQALSITLNGSAPACSSAGSNSLLVGQYAFSLSGYNNGGFLTVIGSFTADGAGNITAGEADTNGVLGAQNGNLVTSASSYSVGSDNRGCATFATPFGTFYTRFALGGVSAGVATAGRIIEFDNPGSSAYVAAGQILQQSPTAFVTKLTGTYYLKTIGWDSGTSARIACTGLVIASTLRFSFLEQDCNDNGAVSNSTNTLTSSNTTLNTYGLADTNGRGTGTYLVSGNTTDITYYWISQSQLFVVNSDSSPMYSGTWQLQDLPAGKTAFDQTAFNGAAIAYSTGVGLAGAGGDVSLAIETADGTSSLTTQLYRNSAGVWQTPNPSTYTCTYSVISVGRVTLTGCIANPPISYLDAATSGLLLGADAAMEVGAFESQTAGLTNSSLAGTYFVGTSEVVNQGAQAQVGILTLASDGTLTSTIDLASTSTQTAGSAGSDTYSLNSNGTFSLGSSGSTILGAAISGSKLVLVSDPTLTYPTLTVGQR
jgi:hypothetical protein